MQYIVPVTPVEVGPSVASSWQNVDVTAYVPSNASGVLLHVVAATIGQGFGVRKNGSTDERTTAIFPGHCWAGIGIDTSKIFQIYIATTATDIDVYLVGYTRNILGANYSGVVWLDNGIDKSLGATGTWTDIDCSDVKLDAQDVPVAFIFEVDIATDENYSFGLRKNGSTDNRTNLGVGHNCFTAIVGCDSGSIVEGYVQATSTKFYCVGYITEDAGATFNTNATDVSLADTGAWTDISVNSSATIAVIETSHTNLYDYGLRKNGSAENIYAGGRYHTWAFVECDTNGVIEGQISNVGVDFFVVGYISPVNINTFTDGIGGAETIIRQLKTGALKTLHFVRSKFAAAFVRTKNTITFLDRWG